jgi:hypothetical protein
LTISPAFGAGKIFSKGVQTTIEAEGYAHFGLNRQVSPPFRRIYQPQRPTIQACGVLRKAIASAIIN